MSQSANEKSLIYKAPFTQVTAGQRAFQMSDKPEYWIYMRLSNEKIKDNNNSGKTWTL